MHPTGTKNDPKLFRCISPSHGFGNSYSDIDHALLRLFFVICGSWIIQAAARSVNKISDFTIDTYIGLSSCAHGQALEKRCCAASAISASRAEL